MLQRGPCGAAALWRKQFDSWEVVFVPTSEDIFSEDIPVVSEI